MPPSPPASGRAAAARAASTAAPGWDWQAGRTSRALTLCQLRHRLLQLLQPGACGVAAPGGQGAADWEVSSPRGWLAPAACRHLGLVCVCCSQQPLSSRTSAWRMPPNMPLQLHISHRGSSSTLPCRSIIPIFSSPCQILALSSADKEHGGSCCSTCCWRGTAGGRRPLRGGGRDPLHPTVSSATYPSQQCTTNGWQLTLRDVVRRPV